MRPTRRRTLALLGTGVSLGLSGCSWGQEGAVSVVLENRDDTRHLLSATVTSIPDGQGGYTPYYDETQQLDPGEGNTTQNAIPFTDHEPEIMVLAVMENESARRADIELSYDLEELRVSITEDEQVEIETRTE